MSDADAVETASSPAEEVPPEKPVPQDDVNEAAAEPSEAEKDAAQPMPAEPSIPAGLSKEEVFNAAKQDALTDDWSCIKGPPTYNDRLPGLRYGSSIEMRPLMMMPPCPCAGGVKTLPHADDGAVLDANGLWHSPADEYPNSAIAGLKKPAVSIITHPPPFAPDVPPFDPSEAEKATASAAKSAMYASSSSSTAPSTPMSGGPQSVGDSPGADSAQQAMLHGVQRGQVAKGSFIVPDAITKTYYPGSEPYAADFGCVAPMQTAPYQTPGKRWKDTPSWTAIPVATPCPCALGTFSELKQPKASHIPPVPDSVFVSPSLGGVTANQVAPWQGGGSYLQENVGIAGMVLALASTALLSRPSAAARPGSAACCDEQPRQGQPMSGAAVIERRRCAASFL